MNTLLAEFFRHNRWANLRLLNVCADLSAAQWEASAPGTYGSVRDTLVHLLAAEQRYVRLLAGVEPPVLVSEREPSPGIEQLRASAAWSGDVLVQVAAETEANRVLRGEYRGEQYAMPVAVPLIQAINHATEHRAHIVSILSQHGVEPPAIDGWDFESELKAGRATPRAPSA